LKQVAACLAVKSSVVAAFGGVVVHHYLEADAEVAAAMAEVAETVAAAVAATEDVPLAVVKHDVDARSAAMVDMVPVAVEEVRVVGASEGSETHSYL
jgi:hypothetical protein